MDPNEILVRLRELVEQTLQCHADQVLLDPPLSHEQIETAELFENLDTWLSKGGFLPDAWKR